MSTDDAASGVLHDFGHIVCSHCDLFFLLSRELLGWALGVRSRNGQHMGWEGKSVGDALCLTPLASVSVPACMCVNPCVSVSKWVSVFIVCTQV